MTAERVEKVCATCQSMRVMRDAWAVWNSDTQQWELGNMFDKRSYRLTRIHECFTRYNVRIEVIEPDGSVARGLWPLHGGGAIGGELVNTFSGNDGRKVRSAAIRWAKIAKRW